VSGEIDRYKFALRILEESLGSDLIKKEVHKIAGWNPEGTAGLHPLVLLWYKAREELSLAELTGSFPNSNWTQEALAVGELLLAAKENNQLESNLNKLRDPKQWQETINVLRSELS
jgi:hypothetical protein